MRSQFVPTSNSAQFLAKFGELQNRGAGEACQMLIEGEPGLGKTTTIEWWAVQTGAVFLRAKAKWTAPWFMRELLGALRKVPEHSFEKMFRQAVGALADEAQAAEREGRVFAVVIDEIDHIAGDKKALETIRDLSDLLEIPFVLVGMGTVRHRLARFPQIASRISQPVEFKTAPVEDAAQMVRGLCEVPVKDDLIAYLHKASAGRAREIKEGIAAIERCGRRQPGREIGMAEMAGQVLLYDRATGKPILVRQ